MIRFGRLETARCTLCGAETSVSSGSNIDGALVEIGNWADQHEAKHRAWAEIGATIAGQVFAIYLLFKNIDTLAGTIGYVDLIGPIAIVVVVGALLYAMWLKRSNREKFDVIGRMIDEGQATP